MDRLVYLWGMNYLAHAYLSFGIPEILTGNMISDFVKGKKKFDFPSGIRQGITLHRLIDEFTDSHPATREARQFFRPAYRLYAGAFVDVVYDHFLALDTSEFLPGTLGEFAAETYEKLSAFAPVFPEPFAGMFPYMRSQNWLLNYQNREGIRSSFGGLVRRAAYLHEARTAFGVFEENYLALGDIYRSFFPHLKTFASDTLRDLRGSVE